jgi:prolipoprotein diacylglyceryl transferase
MILSVITWNVDPVAFTIPLWGKEIRWYALSFFVGFALGLWIVRKIWENERLKEEWLDHLFFYTFFATVIGSRLGHVLFYNPGYYFAHPIEIFKVWEGGLASHGGTLGIVIAIWIYSKKVTHKSMLWTFDRLVVPVGFVAALIRLGNLMNSEIYGRPTSLSWGIRFIRDPKWSWPVNLGGSGAMPCHPTQLYEAFFYIITAIVCLWMYWKRKDYKYEGLIFGVFLIGIFLSRFFVEFLKNTQEDFENSMILDMGQILSIPFIIAGFWFMYKGLKARKNDLIPVKNPRKSA